jgi:hypothetical protein
MLLIEWNRDHDYLMADGKRFACSCIVRNELNGKRLSHDVIRTMPGGYPYMPRRFPTGTWTVLKPRPREDGYRAPYFIPTDAFQDVPMWELDGRGCYLRATDKIVRDTAYGLHYSRDSITTWGCIRIDTREEVLALVRLIHEQMDEYEPVKLLVREG